MAKKKHAHIEQQKETRKLSVLAESVLELTNGEQIEVMRHDGAYYYCESRKFRISHPNIAKVLSVREWKDEQKEQEPTEAPDFEHTASDILDDIIEGNAEEDGVVSKLYSDEFENLSDDVSDTQDNVNEELPFTDSGIEGDNDGD